MSICSRPELHLLADIISLYVYTTQHLRLVSLLTYLLIPPVSPFLPLEGLRGSRGQTTPCNGKDWFHSE